MSLYVTCNYVQVRSKVKCLESQVKCSLPKLTLRPSQGRGGARSTRVAVFIPTEPPPTLGTTNKLPNKQTVNLANKHQIHYTYPGFEVCALILFSWTEYGTCFAFTVMYGLEYIDDSKRLKLTTECTLQCTAVYCSINAWLLLYGLVLFYLCWYIGWKWTALNALYALYALYAL